MNTENLNEDFMEDKCKDNSIIALKLYDQCFLDECVQLGPIESAEHCECIILECENSIKDFGRLILPGRPVCVPECVCKVRLVEDSFKIKKVEILEVTKSPLRKDYWDIKIRIEFKFEIQLLDEKMQPLKILCCENCYKHINKQDKVKDYITCSVCYLKEVVLCGGETDSPVMASDIFTPTQSVDNNSPHALVEAKAYPIDIRLTCPLDACCCDEVYDDIYDEPIKLIYITIGINAIVRLFRFQSINIPICGIAIPKHCCDVNEDPCKFFSEMEFPNNDFSPN